MSRRTPRRNLHRFAMPFSFFDQAETPVNRVGDLAVSDLAERGCVEDQPQHFQRAAADATRRRAPGISNQDNNGDF